MSAINSWFHAEAHNEIFEVAFIFWLLSNLALISKIYIIINKEPVEGVRIMFIILVLLLTLASFLYVTIGIAKKIFSIFALITPLVVLGVGLLIAMN